MDVQRRSLSKLFNPLFNIRQNRPLFTAWAYSGLPKIHLPDLDGQDDRGVREVRFRLCY